MGLLWTLTSYCLGAEIFIICLFLLPFLSARKWRMIFKLRIFAFISNYMIYFVVGLGIIFADSANKLRKSNSQLASIDKNTNFANADYLVMKRTDLFLAQRNLYISGFTLFLWLVLTRLVKLITSQDQLELECEATKKQALSATEAAQKFVNEAQVKEDNKNNDEKSPALLEIQTELEKAKKSLEFTNSQLKTTFADLEAMKSQSEATKREYDRLLNELHPAESKDQPSKKEN